MVNRALKLSANRPPLSGQPQRLFRLLRWCLVGAMLLFGWLLAIASLAGGGVYGYLLRTMCLFCIVLIPPIHGRMRYS